MSTYVQQLEDAAHRVDQLEQALRSIHEVLFPERYIGVAEMERLAIPHDGGYYQWSADTPEAIASTLAGIHRELNIPGWVTDREPKP